MKWPRRHQHQPEAETNKNKTMQNSNKKPSSIPFFSRVLPYFCLSQLSIKKPTPRPPSNPKLRTEPRPISDSFLRGPPAPPQTTSFPWSPPATLTTTALASDLDRVVADPDLPWRTRFLADSILDRSAATEDCFAGSRPSRPRISDPSRRSRGVRIRDPRLPLSAGNRSGSPESAAGGPSGHRLRRGERSIARSGQDSYQERRGRRGRGAKGEERESLAATKYSSAPHEDFRESMAEMIAVEGIARPEELEKLLACYLCLNSDEHHDAIVQAFRSVWSELNRDQFGSRFASESVHGYGHGFFPKSKRCYGGSSDGE